MPIPDLDDLNDGQVKDLLAQALDRLSVAEIVAVIKETMDQEDAAEMLLMLYPSIK